MKHTRKFARSKEMLERIRVGRIVEFLSSLKYGTFFFSEPKPLVFYERENPSM